jgi:DNA-binding HxlR family transcriptional regulator
VKVLEKKDEKKFSSTHVAEAVETVFGCKWSLRILEQIRKGTTRPGAIERALPGLTTKVQHYYFGRMMDLGILAKTSFPEIPPRVEYKLTSFGKRFVKILDSIQELQGELNREGK